MQNTAMDIDNRQEQENDQPILAAIDLGSNSFHMIIARLRDNHFQVVDKLREMVQLRAGLDERDYLSKVAQDRAIACLERFGERIKDLPEDSVRIVGTNTLRVAKNSKTFLKKAKKALGHSIDIVAGEEEARLVYLGVAHTLSFDDTRRLVIDIGGGSTEFIIGEGFTGLERESLEMGCVSFSQRFFSDGVISQTRIQAAVIAAATRLRAIQKNYRDIGWVEAIGASGTIRCVAEIVKDQGWTDDGIITADSLDQLIDLMVDAGGIDALPFSNLSEERKSVLPGGVAILKAAFNQLKLDKMTVSDGALREGLLYDLLGRIRHDDERERTVIAMARRYQVDTTQADHVINMLDRLFAQVSKLWVLDSKHGQYLHWAARLHEIGLSISHDQYHKHSYYLVQHCTLPGFSRIEQHMLAVLVRGHRRSFPKKYIKTLPRDSQLVAQRLIILLRLAMVFNRGRTITEDISPILQVRAKTLQLTLPQGWLADHPLTEADLLQEVDYLSDIGISLTVQ